MIYGTLTLVRGDDQDVGVAVTNTDGTPYILSGCALTFVAQVSAANSAPVLTRNADIINAVEGSGMFSFTPPDTANIDDLSHPFTIRLLSSGGRVTTLMNGCMSVVPGALAC